VHDTETACFDGTPDFLSGDTCNTIAGLLLIAGQPEQHGHRRYRRSGGLIYGDRETGYSCHFPNTCEWLF
jgi:hypothetical protein